MEQHQPRNAVGTTIRKMRASKGLTQAMLVARCNVAGLDISRGTLAKIEAQIRGVSDIELFIIAKIFKVKIEDLFSKI
ncbi:MAG: helix-turn-helix transcriptional regulator [bacterium]